MKLLPLLLATALVPIAAHAQVTSVFGRTGAVTAQTGDYNASQVTNAAAKNATNTFTAYQLVCVNGGPCGLSPKIGVAYNAIGALSGGENDLFDGVAQDGFAQYQAERRDTGSTGVGANEIVGSYLGAAYMDTGSDPSDAGMLLYTTERQTTGHNGMGLELDYTPNGSTALTRGISVSPQGLGGVTVGGGFASNNPYSYTAPADLGPGTLNAADSIVTGNHFRSDGTAPTVSSCGASPTIRGTDVAGEVNTGASVTACTITFAKAYHSVPICMVQTKANPSPVTYVVSSSTTLLTVNFSASLHGGWFYSCQDPS